MKKVFGIMAIASLATILWTSATIDQPEVKGLEVGDTAPDFSLENIDGRMISLADYEPEAGHDDIKGYIVTFTCNTCPYAVMYEDRLIDLHQKMAPKGWPVIAIQPNDPEVQPGDSMEKMKERAQEKGFPFVYLMDKGQKVYPKYGAERTPHIYVLDTKRKVHYIGALDDNARNPEAVTRNYVVEAIEAVEGGSKPDPDFTKAIGCTIKTKK